ncbi:MAG: hypothetical protein KUL79_03865 [Thauera sp.]|nr:hypothetical protein [Thauera sp.]
MEVWRSTGLPGLGLIVAVALLVGAEALLHSDLFMYRLRAVFAVGRAFDKVLHVERETPHLLVLGNSRVDNGIDPRTLARALPSAPSAFNLGLPGAGASALLGIVQRLDKQGLLGPQRIETVLIGLDESLLQDGDALGYEVFFARPELAEDGLRAFLRARIRLWGYADNLKQLREPAKFVQFLHALCGPLEPTGGAAAQRQGYRPGFGDQQDAGQVVRQEAGSTAAPSAAQVGDLFALVDLLQTRGARVAVIFPPLLNRKVLYLEPGHLAAAPYLAVRRALEERDVALFALGPGQHMEPAEFVNAGHLNDHGAQRFSAALGAALAGSSTDAVKRVTGQ